LWVSRGHFRLRRRAVAYRSDTGEVPMMMRRNHRCHHLAAVLMGLMLMVTACRSDHGATGTDNLTAIRIALYPSASTLPVRAAIAQGMFERNGLHIDVTEGQDLPLFMASLAKGQYDVAMSGPTLVLIGAEKGLDLQIVSSLQQSSRDRPNAVWITRDPSITTVAQLKSKTIAVPSLTGIIIDSLVYLLMRDGVPRDEVKFVQAPFAAMGDQLAAGKVDAAVASIPFSAAILSRGFHAHDDVIVEAVRAASGGTVDTAMTSVWAASGPYARDHPDAIRAFRRSISEAVDFLDADATEARAMMRDWLKMPAPVVERSTLPEWGADVTVAEMAPYVTIAKAVGSVRGDPDVTALVWQGT
jgi:NitT/TauT family transport system substrate-binding protein